MDQLMNHCDLFNKQLTIGKALIQLALNSVECCNWLTKFDWDLDLNGNQILFA